MKEDLDIEKFLDEKLTLTQEEKDLIAEKMKKDKDYELLKRKFYYELEGFDLEIELLRRKIKETNNIKKEIKKLEIEKRVLIQECGFIFEYKE